MEILQDIIKGLDSFFEQQGEAKEIELIQYLKSLGQEPFTQFNLSHSKDLFRAHFLIKHALYHLQNSYFQARKFVLHIDLVNIKRQVFLDGRSELAVHDPVKAYYMDISHYFETEEEEVNELLNGFWQKFLARDDLSAALQVLELPEDANRNDVKVQYRKLAQCHHPDKGGCAERFKKISAAKRLLDRALG